MNPNPLAMGLLDDSLSNLPGGPHDVNAFEQALCQWILGLSRELYIQGFHWLQDQWLAQNAQDFAPVRRRSIRWLTPFGQIDLPVCVVRKRGATTGGYLSLSKVLLQPKATRLLSPSLEKQACEFATELNYRPAATLLGRQVQASLSHWLVWRCVQHHGQRLGEDVERDWWPQPSHNCQSELVITELDSAWLRQQPRTARDDPRHGKELSGGFFMHLGLHYTGRERRYAKRGSKSVQLSQKSLWYSTTPLNQFAPKLARQRHYHYPQVQKTVVISDGDEGLERMRERHFEQDIWLLDRWHVDDRLKRLLRDHPEALKQARRGLYTANSERILEALADAQQLVDPGRFAECFGYILGNREGIDALHQVPQGWRTAHGRREPRVKPSSGGAEKNIEVSINRRFKRQGRSWHPKRAGYLANLRCLQRTIMMPGHPGGIETSFNEPKSNQTRLSLNHRY